MNSTLFGKVLNIELIESNKSVPETIKCLREQIGGSRSIIHNNIGIFFDCSKKGKITVYNYFKHHRGLRKLNTYYVSGNVISKDNKTNIKITSVYNRFDICLQVLSIIVFVILTPILLIFKAHIEGIPFIPFLITCFVFFIIAIIDSINVILIRQKCGSEIVKLMENEIKKRVQNIERWDK